MYVRVISMTTNTRHVITTSRTTLVKDLKEMVRKAFPTAPEGLRLLFGGKQLEDQYSLFDYRINVNDVIQLFDMVGCKDKKVEENSLNKISIPSSSPSTSSSLPTSSTIQEEETFDESEYFKVGDYVDVKDYQYGSWFIGKLIKIKKDTSSRDESINPISPVENDGFIYVVEFLMCPGESPIEVQLQQIRPHSSEIVPKDKLKIDNKVLMNYNAEYPKERGYWYDVIIKKIKTSRRGREVFGDVYMGINSAMMRNCNLVFLDDIYVVKPYQLITERTPEDNQIMQTEPTVMRAGPLVCIDCKDDEKKSCKECGCNICGGKDNDDQQVLCDECDHPFHITCLTPPLTEIPKDDDWYCPSCKNDENEIVKAGGKLKVSKKKTPASTSSSKRDWGKGMACVGRTKQCKIVPNNHFGPIPGIEVGTTWLFRVQVSEVGIHRPPVGGIHGREHDGCYSIVLSGGYEDDVDNGEEFLYTGSGGRDLSGNKRTAKQSCNQELVQKNKSIALNCHAKIDCVKGAKAVDWKQGKPIRVVRNYKLAKHSKYAPEEGNRYDGLYKVVKYYPETGKSGFIVWRFVFRRDDPAPAPWTLKGKKRMTELGLEIIYPENYVKPEPVEKKTNKKSKLKELKNNPNKVNNEQSKKESPQDKDDHECPSKKVKLLYELEDEGIKLIAADIANKKYWDDCKNALDRGKKAFLERVEETFLCICCQEIVFEPITTECSHNICKECLKRSFSAEVYQCPCCRADMGSKYSMKINKKLSDALLYFFPAYNTGR